MQANTKTTVCDVRSFSKRFVTEGDGYEGGKVKIIKSEAVYLIISKKFYSKSCNVKLKSSKIHPNTSH